MTDTIEAKLRAAMEGVTPGPWAYRTDKFSGDCGLHAIGTSIFAETFADILYAGEGSRAEAQANARYITLCSPDNISALLDENKALRETLVECQRAATGMAPHNAVCHIGKQIYDVLKEHPAKPSPRSGEKRND